MTEIVFQSVTKSLGGRAVVQDISFELAPSERVALVAAAWATWHSVRAIRRSAVSREAIFAWCWVLAGMLLTMVFVLTLFAVTQVGLLEVVGGK